MLTLLSTVSFHAPTFAFGSILINEDYDALSDIGFRNVCRVDAEGVAHCPHQLPGANCREIPSSRSKVISNHPNKLYSDVPNLSPKPMQIRPPSELHAKAQVAKLPLL